MTSLELRVASAQVGGVFVPLADCSPSNPLLGGYAYLDWTDNGQTRHPGADLNSRGGGDADLGAPVVAAVDGVVEYVRHWDGGPTGYGRYVVLRTESPWTPTTWLQHCHLDRILVQAGQRVAGGAQLGTCGRSGNQPLAHLHWEVCHARKPTWDTWPRGWSVPQIEQYWVRPADWYWGCVQRASEAAEAPPITSEEYEMLNGAQQTAVQAAIWGEYWNPAGADWAIPRAWREQWIAGRYRGRPVSTEQPIPASEDRPAGQFQLFDGGVACWLPNQEVSWDG